MSVNLSQQLSARTSAITYICLYYDHRLTWPQTSAEGFVVLFGLSVLPQCVNTDFFLRFVTYFGFICHVLLLYNHYLS